MPDDRNASRRALDDAARDAARHYRDRETLPPVGTPGWLSARRRRWDDVTLLEAIGEQYGSVARVVAFLLREVVLVAVLFWFVAFVLGLTTDADAETVDLLGLALAPAAAAWTIAVALRLVLGAVTTTVRRRRRATRRRERGES